jgi:hypothetical protein
MSKSKRQIPIPIQNDGSGKHPWQLVLDAKICKQYIDNDLFNLPKQGGK